MIEDHKEDLKAFKREADKAKDPDIKQFSSKFAPMIKSQSGNGANNRRTAQGGV
jgi:hypothetical protein